MNHASQAWLSGRTALVVGGGSAGAEVVRSLEARGATVRQASAALVAAPEIATAFDIAGPVDILVHGGTATPEAASETTTLEAWRAGHSADIDGRFLYAAEFVRRKLAGAGHGAILFLMPSPSARRGHAAALTAHGALENLVKSLAVEWARDGIRINAIASAAAEPVQLESLGHLAAYLVSDYAAYVTGTVMGIDEVG